MKDLLGTSRGRCNKCECSDYTKLSNLDHVCDFCGHYPTEHLILSDISNKTTTNVKAIETLPSCSYSDVGYKMVSTQLESTSDAVNHRQIGLNVPAEETDNHDNICQPENNQSHSQSNLMISHNGISLPSIQSDDTDSVQSQIQTPGLPNMGMIISRVAERRKKRRISANNIHAKIPNPQEALNLLQNTPQLLHGSELIRAIKITKPLREDVYESIPNYLMSPSAITAEVELKFNQSIGSMQQILCNCIRKLKAKNICRLDDLVTFLSSPGEKNILQKGILTKEEISSTNLLGPSCFMIDTRMASKAAIFFNSDSNPIEFSQIKPERAIIITFGLYYLLNLTYPRSFGQILGFLQVALLSETFAEQFVGGNLKEVLNILRL